MNTLVHLFYNKLDQINICIIRGVWLHFHPLHTFISMTGKVSRKYLNYTGLLYTTITVQVHTIVTCCVFDGSVIAFLYSTLSETGNTRFPIKIYGLLEL